MTEPVNIHPPLNFIPKEITCAADYELLAPQFIAADRFAYISGGSGKDETLTANRSAFEGFSIKPRLFSDLTNAKADLHLLEQHFQYPIFLAPLAYQTLVHKEGELATAQGAAATDVGLVASTLSSFSLEAIAEQAGSRRWFQLYIQPNFNDTVTLIKRAEAAGYRALVITVDASVQMPSARAIRAGFTMPEEVKAVNLAGFEMASETSDQSHLSRVFQTYQQGSVSLDQIKTVLDATNLPVLVKGVLNPEDALALKAIGVSGVIVSNHGGRTIDGVPASLMVLPNIRQALGAEFPVLFDGGVRSGNDIFKAIALGANAVLIGRLQVYALAVAGALGVAHMLKLLKEEFELAMAISGCATLSDIHSEALVHKEKV